jgi:ferredoxin
MNRNIIFFFSGTGNSFDATLKIAERLMDTDIVNIASTEHIPPLDNYERIGLVFPVYGFSMPNIVAKFIACLPKNDSAYYFCVVTLGGFEFGAKYRIHEAFDRAGIGLDYISHVFMPENYILFSMAPSDRVIRNNLRNSIKTLGRISADLTECKQLRARKSIFYNAVKKAVREESKKWPLMARDFVIGENCTGCKKCVRICPVENISMSADKIIFGEHCECCLACMHSCPAMAINYGSKTIKKKRYTNPNVNIEDMKKYVINYPI